MKHLSFEFTTKVDFSVPVCGHSFVLRCLPASDARQRVEAHLELNPPAKVVLQRDCFGNVLAVGDLQADHSSFSYAVSGQAWVDGNVALAQQPHAMYRYPGALTVPGDEMIAFAQRCGLEHDAAAALHADEQSARCGELSHAVHQVLEYAPGSTHVSTSAAQAFAQGSGVCQDYAHVMCALLRHWGLPARYVSGLTLGEGATHAWVEVNVDGVWHGFDPTRDRRCDDDYLAISRGRDWADCPIERGVFLGAADQLQTVYMKVMDQ